jgi:hypothetical protein
VTGPITTRERRESKVPRFPGRRQWENESSPYIPVDVIRDLFLREQAKYGSGYASVIAERCGWMRRKSGGDSSAYIGDPSPLLRSLGLKLQKNGLLSKYMKESTAKKIVSAMGYDPVDCGF